MSSKIDVSDCLFSIFSEIASGVIPTPKYNNH
jgi:hypothetical protein